MTLSDFHVLTRESIKASQECLNRIRAGETNGGVPGHSSKDKGAVTPRGDPGPDTVERTPGVGGEMMT